MIDKTLLVLGYYLTLPLTWGVALLAALVVARYPGWMLSYAVAAGVTWAWLVAIAYYRWGWPGWTTVAKSYVPVVLVASGVSLAVVRGAFAVARKRVPDASNR